MPKVLRWRCWISMNALLEAGPELVRRIAFAIDLTNEDQVASVVNQIGETVWPNRYPRQQRRCNWRHEYQESRS